MKKLLVVDDSPFMRMIIKKALKGLEIELLEADNGKKALEVFQEKNPDLILMDIVMPDKTGVEVLNEILKENPKAKIIMCSSMVNDRTVAEVKTLGAKSFIKKPFQDDDFRKKIIEYISY